MSEEEFHFEDEAEDTDGRSTETYEAQSEGSLFGDAAQLALASNKVKEETIKRDQLRAKIEVSVQDIMSVLAWKKVSSLLLLRHFKWNAVLLKEKFFEDSEDVISSSHIDNQPDEFTASLGLAECSLCWDDIEAGDCFSLACQHQICKVCWKSHLLFHLKNSGPSSIGVRCPTRGCRQLCGELVFSTIFGRDSDAMLQYRSYLLDLYSEEHAHIRRCPTPQCESFIFHPMANKMSCGYYPVTCESCSNKFCFGCHNENHGPATCAQMAHWTKKEIDESENTNWITANTKPCPSCTKPIEKNGGCNRMTCSQCRLDWCWICEKAWSKHTSSDAAYACNVLPKETEKQRDIARNELTRYLHFYTRFRIHKQSKKLDSLVLQQVHDRILQENESRTDFTLTDIEYLHTTAKVLFECRHTLSFSYVFAFYLDKGHDKELFEFNQLQLEQNTELLSEYIEDKDRKYGKDEIVNRTSAALNMLRRLQEGTNMPL